MLFQLTELSEEPLHSQISRQLTDKIIDGDLAVGQQLESFRTLARKQRVNVNSVKRAYRELEQQGLITSHRSRGFYVAALTEEQKRAIANQRRLGTKSPLYVLEAFSSQLISVFDPEKLRDIIEDNLKIHFCVDRASFVIYDDQSEKYTWLDSSDRQEQLHIVESDELFVRAAMSKLPISLDSLDEIGLETPFGEELARRNIQILIPLHETEKLLGFILLPNKLNGATYTAEEVNLLLILANQFVTALSTARFYVEAVEKRRMEEELAMARQIQANLLPKTLPNDSDISVAAASIPSRAVGGDFYDVIPIDQNRLALVIADACGKGLPAALLISQIQAMLKSEINNGNSIPAILDHLNKQVFRHTPMDKFVTLFFGIYDTSSGAFEYTSAGHNYPALIRSNGENEWLKAGGPAFGLLDNAEYETETVTLQKGDFLLLYTDGITETMTEQHEEYGEERLLETAMECRCCGAKDVVDSVLDDLSEFYAGNHLLDDRTILVLKRNN